MSWMHSCCCLLWYETPGFRPWSRCSWKCLELSWGWCPSHLCRGDSPAESNVIMSSKNTCIQTLWAQMAEMILTSIVCVLPDDVCPYANMVPLYPSRTSVETTKQLVVKAEKPLVSLGYKHAHRWNLTFYNLLGAGVVHLFLCCVWLKHSVEHVRFTLQHNRGTVSDNTTRTQQQNSALCNFIKKKKCFIHSCLFSVSAQMFPWLIFWSQRRTQTFWSKTIEAIFI